MKVPFVDLKIQYQNIEKEINSAIHSVLENSNFILGENVLEFEKEYSRYLGGGYSVSVGSGLAALYLALLSLDIGPGDEVITVSHTFVATYLAVIQTGAEPVFVDIDPDTYNMDAGKIEEKITQKTKAILPVHLYGHPADMAGINHIARKYSLYVIEDACQAHGAEMEGRKTGLFGDLACFSFYPAKNLGAYGDGGLIVTKQKKLRNKLLQLRNYGQEKKYYHSSFGVNSRLDELQAAVLRVKLKYLDEWNEARKKIARRYIREIQSRHVVCPQELDNYSHVFHLFVIQTPYRKKLQDWLWEKNINTQIHYPVPIHKQKCFVRSNRDRVILPVTEKTAERILSLPIYPEMEENQVSYVIDSINSFSV